MPYFLFLFLIFQTPLTAWGHGERKDCSCPQRSCGPCQKQVLTGKTVQFCGGGDVKVCPRSICENVSSYFACLSKENGQGAGVVPMGDQGLVPMGGPEGLRKPASVVGLQREEKIFLETPGRIQVKNDSRVLSGKNPSHGGPKALLVAEVQQVSPGLQRVHGGPVGPLMKGQKLFVGDGILNQGKGASRLKLKFQNGVVELKILERSKLMFQDPQSILGRFQPFLYLVHGGVELEVSLGEGSLDLLAGQILIRASQGSFGVGYAMGDQGLLVKVESLKGMAEVIKAGDLSGKSIQVAQGQFVHWVSEAPKYLFSMEEKRALDAEGFITPVFEVSPGGEKGLLLGKSKKPAPFVKQNQKKGSGPSRGVASQGVQNGLCQSPEGKFRQCAWSCQGNPKGATECEAEKEGIHCMRRLCNAAGQWSDPTPFASSYKDLCPAQGVRVGACPP